MSKKHNVFLSSPEAVKQFDLDLKNWRLAALLAWLVPGLGHFYQGRNAKGALFMVSIVSLLVFGIYVGQGNGQTTPGDSMINVVYAPTESMAPPTSPRAVITFVSNHWKFLCQSGVGGVVLPALVQRHRVLHEKPPLLGGLLAPPSMTDRNQTSQDSQGNTVYHPNELAKWNYEAGFYFELGTVYTIIAGLLNILVVYDAASGPLIAVQESDEEPDSPAA